MSGEQGQWTVDVNDEESGVIMSISYLDENGVETFETAMAPENAIVFATNIIDKAKWILSNAD